MSGSKHFDRIAWIVTAITLVITVLFMNGAVSEEYYTANVVIDGESYKNVGIRTKGNTSLSTVATMGSERYSFKIEFDHYDSTKSYHGLDKLSLNNLIQDSAMMKDYLTYTMMNEFGVHSSLCSYVYITVNGEDWGLYLAVEGVEEAFLERNYGSNYGELYKPDSLSFGGGRGNGGNFDMSEFNFDVGGACDDSSNGSTFDPSTMFGGNDENGGFSFGGGFEMGSSDVKLQYIDDEPSSYSNIWNNAKTDITEADQNRLILSLKKLSSYEDIESVVDVEQVIRYFIVHNYVCNADSYTGSMVHNYYLYEEDGKLSIIPWDYNLAFGTFTGGNATGTINTPIDTPVSGGSSDRPMLNWIFESEEYTRLYHRYFSEFLSSVDIDGIIENAYNLIKDYVAKDPTAFYSYDEFELGVETIRQFCALRSESISAQLENNETTTDMNYVDASDLTLSDMGSMGGGMGGFGGDMPSMPDSEGDFNGSMPDADGTFDRSENKSDSNEGSDSTIPGGFPGEMSDDFDPSDMHGGFSGNFPAQPSGGGNANAPSGDAESNGENGENRPDGGNMQMPGGDFPFDMNGTNTPASNMTAWIWLAMSIVVLAIGLLIAKLYKH